MAHGLKPQAVRQPEHRGIGGQNVTDHARYAGFGSAAHQAFEQTARQTLVPPVVGHDDGEFAFLPRFIDHVARLGHRPRAAADERFDDQRLVALVVDLRQARQPVGRQLADRREEALVARRRRQRAHQRLLKIGVLRQHRAQRDAASVGQGPDVDQARRIAFNRPAHAPLHHWAQERALGVGADCAAGSKGTFSRNSR